MYFITILCAVTAVCAVEPWTAAPEDDVLEGAVRQVHVFFRHGHREPKSGFPKDPNAGSPIWKNGPGQLTILGRQQGYTFGQNLRLRYHRLLPENRAWKAVKAYSSDVSRTLMTCAAVLAGLLPPSLEDRWSDIDWQPAPIHTNLNNIDNVLASHLNCPHYEKLLEQLPNTISKETQWLYNYVENHSGKKIRSPKSLTNLYTSLDIQQQAGLKIPMWTEPVYTAMKMESARDFLRSTQTQKLTRFRVGPLLKKLIRFNGTNVKHPIVLYSTHDTVLSGLLGFLKVNITEPPNFTAAVIIEYREVRGNFHVQVWYRSRPDEQLIRFSWPDCDVRCTLDKVRQSADSVIPKNWRQECDDLTNEIDLRMSKLVFATFTLTVALMLCAHFADHSTYNEYEIIN